MTLILDSVKKCFVSECVTPPGFWRNCDLSLPKTLSGPEGDPIFHFGWSAADVDGRVDF